MGVHTENFGVSGRRCGSSKREHKALISWTFVTHVFDIGVNLCANLHHNKE